MYNIVISIICFKKILQTDEDDDDGNYVGENDVKHDEVGENDVDDKSSVASQMPVA